MGRAKFQDGTLLIEGTGPSAKYKVRYRVYDADGKSTKKKETIGLVSKISKREALKKKAEIVMRGTQQLPKAVDETSRGSMTLRTYYEQRFLPRKSDWSAATAKKTKYNIEHFVLPKFGDIPIGSIDGLMVQTWLNNAANDGCTVCTVRHMREWMSSLLSVAYEEEFINRNPVKKTVVPRMAAPKDDTIYTEQELALLLSKVTDGRDRAILMVGTFTALRTSEIFGLSWRQFHHNPGDVSYLLIDQIAWDGGIYEDQTKTRKSKRRVPLQDETLRWLLIWQKECPDTSPNALIFPSTNKNGRSKKGAPMDGSHWMQKKIQPLAEKLGLNPNVNFRVLRRSVSSNMQDQKEAVGTVADLLGNDPATTLKHYTEAIPGSVVRAVGDYESRVLSHMPRGPAKLQRVK